MIARHVVMSTVSANRTKRNGCFRVVAIILAFPGAAAGLFTIQVARSYSGQSLLRAGAAQFPAYHDLLKRGSTASSSFVEAWPLTPWVLAAILFAIVAGARYLAEDGFDMFTQEINFWAMVVQLMLFLPLALIWVWLFAGIVSPISIWVYGLAYLIINYAAAVTAAGRP
jgi:hypothetical protein